MKHKTKKLERITKDFGITEKHLFDLKEYGLMFPIEVKKHTDGTEDYYYDTRYVLALIEKFFTNQLNTYKVFKEAAEIAEKRNKILNDAIVPVEDTVEDTVTEEK